MTYDDEYLEFWAKVYEQNPVLARRGVTFVMFIARPAEILEAAKTGQPVSSALLPRQRRAMDRVTTIERARRSWPAARGSRTPVGGAS